MTITDFFEKHDETTAKLRAITNIVADGNERVGARVIDVEEVNSLTSAILVYIKELENEFLKNFTEVKNGKE